MIVDRVQTFLADLNRCWPTATAAQLAEFYHPDVVLLPPDLGAPIIGRTAVVESYAEFLQAAQLVSFEVEKLELFAFPPTCMAHLNFDIVYDLGGDRYQDKGLEIYTIIEQAERLEIVWRCQSVLDSRLTSKSEPGPEG